MGSQKVERARQLEHQANDLRGEAAAADERLDKIEARLHQHARHRPSMI